MEVSIKRRIAISIGVVIAIGMLCGCAAKTTGAAGDQAAFLRDMASGIQARLAVPEQDVETLSDEEYIAYYTQLVNCELNRIETYAGKTFADAKFDRLARHYIEACQTQLDALQYFNNAELYDALWSGGRVIRSGIIIALYEQYDLPITSEQADEYRSSSTASYSVDVSGGGGWPFSDDGEVALDKGDITVVSSGGKLDVTTYGKYFEFYYVIGNNSAHDLSSISINCVILDKSGNVIDTTSASLNATVPSKKQATFEGRIKLDDYPNAKEIKIDGMYYDGNNNYIVHDVDLEESNIENNIICIP